MFTKVTCQGKSMKRGKKRKGKRGREEKGRKEAGVGVGVILFSHSNFTRDPCICARSDSFAQSRTFARNDDICSQDLRIRFQ